MSDRTESRAVVLASGGMDSATAAYEAAADGYEPHLLHTAYGQATEDKERECARLLADEMDSEFLRVETGHLAHQAAVCRGDPPARYDVAGGCRQGSRPAGRHRRVSHRSSRPDRLPVPVQGDAEPEDDPANGELSTDRADIAVDPGDDGADPHHEGNHRDERQDGVTRLHTRP